MGRLTTHILNTADGCPAAGVALRVYAAAKNGGERKLLVSTETNADGRVEGPLLAGDEFPFGAYELAFHIGDYFTARTPERLSFWDIVTVRFQVAEDSHYHIPLLVSPFSYSTYRGS